MRLQRLVARRWILHQPLVRVLSKGFEQSESESALCIVAGDRQQALVAKRQKIIQGGTSNSTRSVRGKAASKDRKAHPTRTFLRRKQVEAPGNGAPQRLAPGRSIALTAGQP